jgi:CheY-like chemotaxis protein
MSIPNSNVHINQGGLSMSYNILVVDDTAFMRKMAADCLKQHGHTVIGEAVNGKEGIQKYQELSPDIVMMDLMMPEMNGIEAIKEILQINADAVILVCSASNQQEQIFDALEAGAKGYLTKPFVSDKMNEVIKKYAEPFLAKPAEVAEVAEKVELKESKENTAEPSEVASSDKQTKSVQEDAIKPTNEVNVMKPNKGNLSNFVTSYMCNWHEEINDETANFSVICSEKEDKIVIEVTGSNLEKQVIQFTFDGFRQLNAWLDQTVVKVN